jgi:predicted NAD/FAD-dependent oxidoreductase
MTPEEDRMIARIEQQAYVKGLADGKAEERAAKIVLMIRTENTSALAHSQIQEVAAEIGAAVEEAHGAACENLIAQCHQHVAQAYEDAAKIADEDIEWAGNNHCSCGERIRARAKERK